MTNDSTDVNVDDVLDMLAFICASTMLSPELVKDSIALLLKENSPLAIEDLYDQVLERTQVLDGAL